MTLLLAIDAGTTAMKAALFDQDGHMLAVDRREYTLLTPAPNRVELDPEVYWAACRAAVGNAITYSGVKPAEVQAVCISSQGETIIPLDANGRPTYNAIVWLDNRADEEAALIAERFSIAEIQQVCGQTEISPIWPACKILWLKRHEPAAFERTARFLLVEDFLLHRLTGQYVSNMSVHSSTLFVDIRRRSWWQPMFDFIGIYPEQFGCLVEPGTKVGQLTQDAADEFGLPGGITAVTGGLDQTIGALGAGNIRPGMVSETTGSAMAMIVVTEEPVLDPGRRVPCFYHSIPGIYTLMPWCQTAGMTLRWFRDQFYSLESSQARLAGRDTYDVMTESVSRVAPGCDGLIVLPHLEGASCPELNPYAKGVFFGVTLRHTRAHFVRGIMEAVAFMLKRNLELVQALGVSVLRVRSLGGGARNPDWLQIKADVLEMPVETVENQEAALLGAAIMAGVGIGLVPDIETGVKKMVRLGRRIEPLSRNAAVYRKAYARYIDLYERLAPLFVSESWI